MSCLCCLCGRGIAQPNGSFTGEDYKVAGLAIDQVLGTEDAWRNRYQKQIEQLRANNPADTARLHTLDSLDAVLQKIPLRVSMTGISTPATVILHDPDTMSTSTIVEYYAPPDTLFAELIRNTMRRESSYRYDIYKLQVQAGFTLVRGKNPGNGFDPIADMALAKPVYDKAHNRCCVYYELGTGQNGCAGFVYLMKVKGQWEAVKYVGAYCK